ncbi:hypothetical protein [Methylobacterium sp. WSM2598]|uniref:hypothetical protein n=1 Tax=Methylobacterium sp. WSM2598 TaxID=398261 RepID=UPI000374CF3B|nr:hypothetical protein [Methylobacterium sp. WSM2598]
MPSRSSEDRAPLKRARDAAQARLIAHFLATRLPGPRFDDPALGAMARAMRDHAGRILAEPEPEGPGRLDPDG